MYRSPDQEPIDIVVVASWNVQVLSSRSGTQLPFQAQIHCTPCPRSEKPCALSLQGMHGKLDVWLSRGQE